MCPGGAELIVACLQCGVGWAGDGYVCGPDIDIDGIPDQQLDCPQKSCVKVSVVRDAHAGSARHWLSIDNPSALFRITA